MKTIGCIVLQGGRPCKIHNSAASAATKRGGVLVPGAPVEMFTQARDANRAIKRTQRVVASLRGSLLDDWAAIGPLLNGAGYEVIPVVKQDCEADNIAAFKERHGIITHRSKSLAPDECPWSALLPHGEDKGKKIPEIMSESARAYEESGRIEHGATEAEAIRALCVRQHFACQL